MHDYKPISTLLDVNVKFSTITNDMTQKEYKIMQEIPFQEVWANSCMIATRPNLAMVIRVVN
jgi:hypothetical protein